MLCFTPFCDSLEKLHDRDSDFLIGAAYCLLPEPISTTEWHFFHATRKWKRKESVLKNAPTSTPADYNLCSLYFPVNFYCLMLAPAERNTWAQSLRSPTSSFPFWSNKDYMGRHANIQKKARFFGFKQSREQVWIFTGDTLSHGHAKYPKYLPECLKIKEHNDK